MSTWLSNLVDNLSEINDKECKSCIKRKEIKLECDFIGDKNNRLNYICKECGKRCFKSINGSISLERFNETSLPDKIIFFIEI